MIEFIKQNLKVKDLFMSEDTLNKIIEDFKSRILENKETFLELYNIDKEKTYQEVSLKALIELLDLYKNEAISDCKKRVIIAKYCGSPIITINILMQSLIKKQATIAIIEDTMLGINKLLITLFNNVLEDYKIAKMIDLENNKTLEEVKQIEDEVDSIICVGDTSGYYKYYKNEIKNLKFIPFKNIALFSNNEELEGLKFEMYKFAIKNGIEIEIYTNVEEFIECVNVDEELENVIVFSKSKTDIKKCEDKIKKYKLYINENPFKNENFKISID